MDTNFRRQTAWSSCGCCPPGQRPAAFLSAHVRLAPRCPAPAGPNGVASAISAGKGYVDVSTVDAATAQAVAAAVRARGAAFLEAPVSGSKGPAEQGQLIFLTAGARRQPWLAACAAFFICMPQKVAHNLAPALWQANSAVPGHASHPAPLLAPGRPSFHPAGDRQLFDAAAPLLDVMGKASFFLGGWFFFFGGPLPCLFGVYVPCWAPRPLL